MKTKKYLKPPPSHVYTCVCHLESIWNSELLLTISLGKPMAPYTSPPNLGVAWRCAIDPFMSSVIIHGSSRLHENILYIIIWLVVSTHLKNISQIGNLPQIGVKIKNIWNHYISICEHTGSCEAYAKLHASSVNEQFPFEWNTPYYILYSPEPARSLWRYFSVCLVHTQPHLNVMSCDLTLTGAVTNQSNGPVPTGWLFVYWSIPICLPFLGIFWSFLHWCYSKIFFVNCECWLPSLKLITISPCKKYCSKASKTFPFSRAAFLQDICVTIFPTKKTFQLGRSFWPPSSHPPLQSGKSHNWWRGREGDLR